MSTSHIAKKVTQAIFIIIFIFLIGFAIVWLWQKQPHPKTTEQDRKSTPSASLNQQSSENLQILSPKDESVTTSPEVTISGKTWPSSYLAIYSNDIFKVAKSDQDGNFASQAKLADGLNLITIQAISQQSKEGLGQSLTLYLAQNSDSTTIYAGPVKSIFDTLITISTQNGQRNIRTNKNTGINFIEDQDESTEQILKNIRIGDYLEVLGDAPGQDTIIAKKIAVTRNNKPQNNEQFIYGKLITPTSQNLPKQSILLKNNQDEKITEILLDKNSQISLDGTDGKSSDLTKGKNVIAILDTRKDQNLVDLIYVLPQ